MKKILNYLLILFLLGAILYVGYYIFLKKDNNYLNVIDQNKTISFKGKEKVKEKEDSNITGVFKDICNGLSEKTAFKKAVESHDLDFCNCITNQEKKKSCKSGIKDTLLYLQAIKQFDENICNKIIDSIKKDACLSIVSKSIKKFEKEDPEYLSEIYRNTHNKKNIDLIERKEQKDLLDYIELSFLYSEKALNKQEKGLDEKSDLEISEKYINKAKEISQNNAEIFRAEAYLNEIKGDLLKSIELYTKSIKLDKNNYLSYVGRGHAYNILGILDKALADFNKAKSLNKTDSFLYTNLCRLENTRSDLISEAIKDCYVVIDKGNDLLNKSEAYQILAGIFINKNDLEKAENLLIQAETLTPNNANLYVGLSDLYILKGDYKKAEEKALKGISIYKTKSILYLKLGLSLYKQGKNKDAIKYINQGLDLVVDDVSLLAPFKFSVKRDMYYLLSDIYENIKDKDNQIKYKKLGNKEFNN